MNNLNCGTHWLLVNSAEIKNGKVKLKLSAIGIPAKPIYRTYHSMGSRFLKDWKALTGSSMPPENEGDLKKKAEGRKCLAKIGPANNPAFVNLVGFLYAMDSIRFWFSHGSLVRTGEKKY